MLQLLRDDFKSPDLVITEAKSEVDGKYVIGKIAGTFFVPDGTSRNKRFYSKNLWNKQLSATAVQERILDRRMMGTISHDIPINDITLSEGKISHITTKLEIRGENQGYGEALILNTPSGQILNNVMRAKVKLHVSSRAEGKFEGETPEGVPKVDEDSYQLQGFDIVIDPGFLQADPQIIESAKNKKYPTMVKILENLNDKPEGENAMDELKDIIAQLSKDKAVLEKNLADSTDKIEKVQHDNTVIQSENKSLQEEVDRLSGIVDENKTKLEVFSKYENIEELDGITEKLEAYGKLGTPEEITEAFDKSEGVLKAYEELGTPDEVNAAFDKLQEKIKAYVALGSIEEITLALEKANEMVDATKEAQSSKEIKDLASELRVSEAQVKALYGKISNEKIKETISGILESRENVKKWKAPSNSSKEKITESKEGKKNPFLTENRSKSLIDKFSK